MPVVTDDEEELTPPAPPPAVDDSYKGIVVDSRETPLSSLLVYVEGGSWIVDYYQQVLDADSEPKPQQLDSPAPYQQYKRISGLELKVTSALTTSQDTETLSMTVTGASTLYPGIIPNKGDMFLADIGDGRVGIFTITNLEKKSILKDACYTIEYVVVAYDEEERIRDLQTKVIQELYFERDFLLHGQNPVVSEKEHVQVRTLAEQSSRLFSMYMNEFYNHQYRTLLIPSQAKSSYDPYVVRTILTMYNSSDHPLLRHMTEYNITGDDAFKAPTIWDALLSADATLLPLIITKTGLISTKEIDNTPRYRGIYFSGIEQCVYPKGENNLNASRDIANPSLLSFTDLTIGKIRGGALAGNVQEVELPGLNPDPNYVYTIHDVSLKDEYVFSKAFYENATGKSKLEVMMGLYLQGKAVDLDMLDKLCEQAVYWTDLQRFYYVPVLLMILRTTVRSI